MEQLISSCDAANSYPMNLVKQSVYEHILSAYSRRLDEQDSRLFRSETEASLDFWDFDHDGEGMFITPVKFFFDEAEISPHLM